MIENSENNRVEEGAQHSRLAGVEMKSGLMRAWLNIKNFMRGRFDLKEGSALQSEVVEGVRKGIDFRHIINSGTRGVPTYLDDCPRSQAHRPNSLLFRYRK